MGWPPSSAPSAQQNVSARDRLIVALDYPSLDAALALVDRLGDAVGWYKVGLELYLAAGRAAVDALVERGHSVFLDLKFHDIPNTVAGAVRSAAGSGAALLTIHAGGGPDMIAAAVDAAAGAAAGAGVVHGHGPRILAVTVLTSMDQAQLAATGVAADPAGQVELLAAMAVEAGAHGLVCSPGEAARLRGRLGTAPLLVTPGIRPSGASAGDQKRIATPAGAIRDGASYLVVGRPITQSADPRQSAESILAEMTAEMTGALPPVP